MQCNAQKDADMRLRCGGQFEAFAPPAILKSPIDGVLLQVCLLPVALCSSHFRLGDLHSFESSCNRLVRLAAVRWCDCPDRSVLIIDNDTVTKASDESNVHSGCAQLPIPDAAGRDRRPGCAQGAVRFSPSPTTFHAMLRHVTSHSRALSATFLSIHAKLLPISTDPRAKTAPSLALPRHLAQCHLARPANALKRPFPHSYPKFTHSFVLPDAGAAGCADGGHGGDHAPWTLPRCIPPRPPLLQDARPRPPGLRVSEQQVRGVLVRSSVRSRNDTGSGSTVALCNAGGPATRYNGG
eukprot:2039846-Rhodomonas_salina.2